MLVLVISLPALVMTVFDTSSSATSYQPRRYCRQLCCGLREGAPRRRTWIRRLLLLNASIMFLEGWNELMHLDCSSISQNSPEEADGDLARLDSAGLEDMRGFLDWRQLNVQSLSSKSARLSYFVFFLEVTLVVILAPTSLVYRRSLFVSFGGLLVSSLI